jgi:hypothetical protein
MSARIKIDQVGLPAGVAGVSRTDGLATGALVTLTNTDPLGVTTFRLLWGPEDDATAEASLAATVDPDVWTFSPDSLCYGSYRIELLEDGIPVERRIFGIRTPTNSLLIPALNELASRHASWANAGADQSELSENNATDFDDADLNALPYAGWWRSLIELYHLIESGTATIADHAIGYVKLPLAAAAPSFIGALVNGNFGEITQATLAGLLRGIGLTISSGTLRTRHRPRRIQEYDYFATGTTVSGSIGKLGWHLLGNGTPAYTKATGTSLNAFKASLTTSAAANDRAVLCWGDTESRGVAIASELALLQSLARVGTTITDLRVFFGLHGDFSQEPSAATNCLGIYYDSAVSPNWQIIARIAGAGSPVVTSAVVPVNTHELLTMHQPTAGTWNFYVGNTQVGSITTGIPTAAMNIGYRAQTLTTSARSFHLGYFGLNGDLAGALNDDNFLEA